MEKGSQKSNHPHPAVDCGPQTTKRVEIHRHWNNFIHQTSPSKKRRGMKHVPTDPMLLARDLHLKSQQYHKNGLRTENWKLLHYLRKKHERRTAKVFVDNHWAFLKALINGTEAIAFLQHPFLLGR
jgi:hypothetical protein